MAGITATDRLEGLGELARQRPETQEATWRLLGALSFLSPDHAIPPTVFQPSPSPPINTAGQDLLPWLVAVTPLPPTPPSTPPPTIEATTENDSDDDSSAGEDSDDDSSVGVNSDDDTDDEDIRPIASPLSRTNDHSSVPGIKNHFEEAIQPLLETGIVRRARARGPITRIDRDTQALYRGLTVRRHGQRDFDLAVRMLLSQAVALPSSSSSSSSSGSSDQETLLMHHVLALAEHHEHYARWNNDDDVITPPSPPTFSLLSFLAAGESELCSTEEEYANDVMFAHCRFESTPELEQLTKRTLELAGYREHRAHEMTRR